MEQALPPSPRKGRGAVSNPDGRFESKSRFAVHDGWDIDDDDLPPLRTHVTDHPCKTVISRNASPDIPFEQSINPYQGCEHGCVYCFARPSHSYLGLSPGLDFETRITAKPNAAETLARELRHPAYKPSPIMLGANTDPYQPIERERGITREILEVLAAHNHPVAIVTKSALVERDLDILGPMASKGLAGVGVSVTTLDGALARTLEPRAAAPAKRLRTIRRLSGAGVPVSVLAAPMIPFLNDHELERILSAAKDAGATGAGYILLRLPRELKDLFTEWLQTHAPGKAKHVLNNLRQNRDGQLYVADFGIRMTGTGEMAEILRKRFHIACKNLGLNAERTEDFDLDTTQFSPPLMPGDQLSFF